MKAFKKNRFLAFLSVLLISVSCTGSLEETEYQKIRNQNQVEKAVTRLSSDHLLAFETPKEKSREAYPWEKTSFEKYPLITKEFFRCKGSSENSSYLYNTERIFDCNGSARHSLPLKDGKEFIYPVLIDILNHLQEKLDAKVVVTCGHRCPQHNRFSDHSEFNRTSKHMLGAEVDFYVEGFEKEPKKIVDAIMSYYTKHEYENKPEYQDFKRYTKKNLNVATNPWFNHEIFIKLYLSHEGRDKDNSHSYPYISIQVRNDSEENEQVSYTWQKAFYNYLRY